METSVSGFKQQGCWADIVEHGERITAALVELELTDTDFEEWNEWRPKADDRLNEDVNEKTAKKAVVDKGKGERKGHSPNEDLVKAGRKLSDTGQRNSPQEAAADVQDSVSYTARALDTLSRKAMRLLENSVYKHIMTKISPYYFDNELISANISRTSKLGEDHPEFILEVDINDDTLKDKVAAELNEFENVDRWHMDTPKNTTNAEHAEGQDITEEHSGVAHSVTQVSKPKEKHKKSLPSEQ